MKAEFQHFFAIPDESRPIMIIGNTDILFTLKRLEIAFCHNFQSIRISLILSIQVLVKYMEYL